MAETWKIAIFCVVSSAKRLCACIKLGQVKKKFWPVLLQIQLKEQTHQIVCTSLKNFLISNEIWESAQMVHRFVAFVGPKSTRLNSTCFLVYANALSLHLFSLSTASYHIFV